MQSLQSSGGHGAARNLIQRLRSAQSHGRMATLIGVVVLLAAMAHLYAQSRTGTATLVLQVHPEALLQSQNGSVRLTVRLARGSTARLWAASSCTVPSPQAHVISNSGIYILPLSELALAGSGLSANTLRVCLVSSDGVLNDSLLVETVGNANGVTVQRAMPLISPNGASVDVPSGWVVTTRAGRTTLANP